MSRKPMQKKLLPVGIASFSEMREMNYYYVDKTKLIVDLVETSRFVFLSRPRRFGKSLTIDTIAELFAGNKPLFEGLYAENHWNWSQSHPVIRLSFASESEQNNLDQIRNNIRKQLKRNAKSLGVALEKRDLEMDLGSAFEDLILNTQENYQKKVIVLIDEYDKPIIDNLDEREISLEVRSLLRSLYSRLKNCASSIRFAMLTGVSKFGQMSLFSGLNHIDDITLSEEYSALCGYTQEELEREFAPELEGVDLAEVRRWYNGYNWKGESVYNPFDILLFLKNRHSYKPYWIQTGGNVSLLYKAIQREDIQTLDIINRTESGESLLAHTDIGSLSPIPIMFQTGYLTIDKVIPNGSLGESYQLKFPNNEVRVAFNSDLWRWYTKKDMFAQRSRVVEAVRAGDLDQLKTEISSAFAGIPHNWFRNNDIARYEGFCASCFYMFFASCCTLVRPEDVSTQGQVDLVIGEEGNIFVFEFKMKRAGDAQSALKQIREKRYADKYRAETKQIFEVGVSFDGETREVVFAVEGKRDES